MKKISILIVALLSLVFTFNVFAMEIEYNNPNDSNEPTLIIPNPKNEKINADRTLDYKWTWISDEIVARFQPGKRADDRREYLQESFNYGMICGGHGIKDDGGKRETYSGKWSQSEDGIWSFRFDDYTIPVDITKIDGVLYAFNGYGELVEGYDYWNGHKTAADGLVTCTDPEFITYLESQYIPDCTSHE